MLNRGCGQHNSQLGKLVGKACCHMSNRPLAQQHDGPGGRREHARLVGRHLAYRTRRVDVCHHDGKGLAVAPLASSQFSECLLVCGVAYQMKPTEPLHSYDSALGQHRDCAGENRIRTIAALRLPLRRRSWSVVLHARLRVFPEFNPTQLGTALETGIGLRVKPTIAWIGILARAIGAHLKRRHGRLGTIVGQLIDDREARAAIRAVDERIPVAPVARVEQLCKAIVAGGQIGRHQRAFVGIIDLRFADLKRRAILERNLFQLDFLHTRSCWRIHVQLSYKLIDELRFPFGVDEYAIEVVQHPARNEIASRKPVHKRPEPHSLHDTAHAYVKCINHVAHLDVTHLAFPSRTESAPTAKAIAPARRRPVGPRWPSCAASRQNCRTGADAGSGALAQTG